MDHIVRTLLFFLSCGPDPDDVPDKISSQVWKQGAPSQKTNFKYSYQRCHLRNFHHQWEGGRHVGMRRRQVWLEWELLHILLWFEMSELEWSEEAHSLVLPDICVSSARRPLMMASLKKSDNSGLETLCSDNNSKWVYLLERWRRVCISGSS